MYAKKRRVHPVYMAKKVLPRPRLPRLRKTYIREWRKQPTTRYPDGMPLEVLAERVGEKIGGMTHASLSRIERGLQPYSQAILEAIADELTNGDVASLLMRNPTDPEGMWSIWEQAKPGERRMIVNIVKTVVKTGT